MNILIVDDVPQNLKRLRAVLESAGHDVFEAVDGVRAMEVLEREQIDAVVSDILMPNMDGYRLCYEIRQSEQLKQTPFIAYTASFLSKADEKLCMDMGADKYLRKPATSRDLLAALDEARKCEHRAPSVGVGVIGVLREYSERLVSELEERSVELTSVSEVSRIQAAALHTVANAVVITDHEGTIEWVNPAFTELTGYSAEEAIGQTPRILKSGVQDAAFYAEFWKTISSGNRWRGEFTNRCKDGSRYISDHTVSPVINAEGKITNFVGVMNDVTSQRDAEDKLRHAHARLKFLLANSPAVIYALSLKGGEVRPHIVSENIYDLLGFEVAEAMSYEWWAGQLHPDDRDTAIAGVSESIAAGSSKVEYRIRHKDGSVRVIEDTRRVTFGERGEPEELVGVWADVTDRKAAERALSESEERFRQMAENILEVFWMTDPSKEELIYVSPAYEAIWGRTVASLFASPRDWLEAILPEDRERIIRASATQEVEGSYDVEYRIVRPDGELRWIRDRAFPIHAADGTVTRVTGVASDITAQKLAQLELRTLNSELERRIEQRTAELESAKAEAERANLAKSEFLSRMSHELRTPMNAILGFGQLLEGSDLSELEQESVRHILRGGRHLLSLINDVLEMAKIEINTLGFSIEAVNLSELLSECVDLMSPIAKERRVHLSFDDPEPVFGRADHQRLRQVVLNLVSNAIKYNVPGGSVAVSAVKRADGFVTIEVRDTGVGIPQAMLDRLFTPFDRLGAETKGIEGTGLGLSLSKTLVQSMGGELKVESQEGVGSCFSVLLVEAIDPGAGAVVRVTAGRSTAPNSGQRRILLIEDNLTNVELMQRIFEEDAGVELMTAMQGRLGLELAAEHTPGVILLDLHLPDMSGLEVLHALKADAELSKVPVIVISADALAARADHLIKEGAFRYVTKPFSVRDLIAAVDDALGAEDG